MFQCPRTMPDVTRYMPLERALRDGKGGTICVHTSPGPPGVRSCDIRSRALAAPNLSDIVDT